MEIYRPPRTPVLNLLEDGVSAGVHTGPAGRRSLLAEKASESLLDSRVDCRPRLNLPQDGGGSLRSHLGSSGDIASRRGQLGSPTRGPAGLAYCANRATRRERSDREMWPVRDTDGDANRALRLSASTQPLVEHSIPTNFNNNYRPSSPGIQNRPPPPPCGYQIDHRQFVSSSTNEYPRQTSKPNLVRGNFVVGDDATDILLQQRNDLTSYNSFNYYRTSNDYGAFYNRPNPGLSHGRCGDEEAFVSSLRRYPACTQERTKSTDLLQAITYLQLNVNNKNIQARTLRFLRVKAMEVEKELHRLQVKLANRGATSDMSKELVKGPSQAGEIRKTRASLRREERAGKRLIMTKAEEKKLELRASQSYESYNYLKVSSNEMSKGVIANKGVDVRYLTDINSELQKFMATEESALKLCSKLSKRYTEHRKHYHRDNSDQNTWCDATAPFLADASQEEVAETSTQFPSAPMIRCICNNTSSCTCKTNQFTREGFIAQKVNEWMGEIPVYPNETSQEKELRAVLVRNLKKSMLTMASDSNFVENARQYIEECARKIPMWKPETKTDQEALEIQVVNNLLAKLDGVAVFAFDKNIMDAFEIVKLKLKDSNCELVNRDEIMKDVTKQLRDIIANRKDDTAYRETLRSKVADIIAELPIDAKPGVRRQTIENLADEVAVRLMNVQGLSKADSECAVDETTSTRRITSSDDESGEDNLPQDVVKKPERKSVNNAETKDSVSDVTLTRKYSTEINPVANLMNEEISEEETNEIEEYFSLPRTSVESGKVRIISKWLADDEDFAIVDQEGRDRMATKVVRQLDALQKKDQDVETLLPLEILKALEQETKDTGVVFTEEQKTEIVDELMNKIIHNNTFQKTQDNKSDNQRKKWARGGMSSCSCKGTQELKKVGHDEVEDLLNGTKVSLEPDAIRELEVILADQTIRGKTGAEAAAETSLFLQDSGNISANEDDEIAKQFTRRVAHTSTPRPADRISGSSEVALSPIASDTLFVPRREKSSTKPKLTKKLSEQLEQAIRDWSVEHNAYLAESNVTRLAADFVKWSRQFDEIAGYDTVDEEGSLRNHLIQWLESNADLSRRQDFSLLVDNLVEHLRSVQLPSTSRGRQEKVSELENTGELSDSVALWCDKLDTGSSPQGQTLKQRLVSKIMLKISALNMNPATLNDDFLYESMLSDEIDQLLDKFSQSRELAENKETMKRELINSVLAAKSTIKEEQAGNTYRQQVIDTMKRILPCMCGTAEVDKKFEDMRNNIADAFMNITVACQQRDCEVAKFYAEVEKYVAEYTKYGCARPKGKELMRNLLMELQNIPKPSEAALMSQLEEIKVREEVRSWFNQLPIQSDAPCLDLQVNKIILLLSMRLREIEKQNNCKTNPNYQKKLQMEITKWLTKLPLQQGINLQAISLRFAQAFKDKLMMRGVEEKNPLSCGLSAEDRAHMDKIRGRSGDEDTSVCPSVSGRPSILAMPRAAPSTSGRPSHPAMPRVHACGRPCLPVVNEDILQKSEHQLCRCQHSTQTIPASQPHCDVPLCSTNAEVQTSRRETSPGTNDLSHCVGSTQGHRQDSRYESRTRRNVSNEISYGSFASNRMDRGPCSPNYDCHQSCATNSPHCSPSQMRAPLRHMKRAPKERGRSSVYHDTCSHPAELRVARHYDSGSSDSHESRRGSCGRGQADRPNENWYDCMKPLELIRDTCSDQRRSKSGNKRSDPRRRSILNSKGHCQWCNKPSVKCNRVCAMNCPHPSFMYFRK